MNKVGCFLSGGHIYSDKNLIMTEDVRSDQVVFINYCDKCGKQITVNIPREAIFSKDLEEILRSKSILKGE